MRCVKFGLVIFMCRELVAQITMTAMKSALNIEFALIVTLKLFLCKLKIQIYNPLVNACLRIARFTSEYFTYLLIEISFVN